MNYILLNLSFWIHVGFSTIWIFHGATWTEFQAVIGLSLTTVIVVAIPESHFFILCVKLEKQFSQNWIGFKGFSVLDGFGTLYSSIPPALRRSSKAFQKTYWLKLDRVQRLFGSGRFWNDQPHAYNGSGCIPPSLQSYKGCCNALKLDRGTKDHTLTTCPVVFLNGFGATKVIKGISKSHSL